MLFVLRGQGFQLPLAAVQDVLALGLDIAGFGEGLLCHHGAHQLINQHGKEYNVSDKRSVTGQR